ncbi:MAG TPA: PAS domain S-box protein [Clostridiales bacterium]|nr:PAS domain S-box protein [Clostridiales bacterium]
MIILWITLAVYYDLSFITITLLASVFFSIISIVTGIMLLRNWKVSMLERIIIGAIFLIWGLHKTYYPYLYPEFRNSAIGYMSEIILANMLNFCILLIYLHKIRNQLFESESRFRLLADNAQDLIYRYRFSPTPEFEYVSPSALKITGYEPEKFYQNPNFFKELAHPEDKTLFDIFQNPTSNSPETIIARWLHKDGHYIWTEQHNTLILDDTQNPYAIEGIIRDITARKMAEENMQQARKSRQLLLSYISHELRTPITSILGYITALLDGTISEEESKQKSLKLIYSKALMLQRLIQDLFQLTKLESKQFSFNFSQISVLELIQEICFKYEWDIKNAKLDYELNYDDFQKNPELEVIADIERIEQVFSNLIFNAIKHTPPGGKIKVCCKKDKEHILFCIQDTGLGIPPKDLPHIFERFYKGQKINEHTPTGSGLGLTIAKEIIHAHKGEIWVESELSKGTKFYFTLPIYCEPTS